MDTQPHSWRREPWPWLLMAGPAAVIVAGIVTSVIAFRGADGLVADDYYRQGLAINRTLARDATARSIGLRGEVSFGDGRVSATLSASRPLPERIRLRLVHATRAGEDRVATLARDADGRFSAPFEAPTGGRWSLVLESPEWRVTSAADLRVQRAVTLGSGT
jgi:hypothetical protein